MNPVGNSGGNRVSVTDNTGYQVIAEASNIFLKHYKDEEFLSAVKKHRNFRFTFSTCSQVAQNIRKANFRINLRTFDDQKSDTIAGTIKDNGIINIRFNKAMLGNDPDSYTPKLLKQRVETLMHEFMHGVGYGHFTNKKTNYNKKTVPYKVAEIFVKYLTRKSILSGLE